MPQFEEDDFPTLPLEGDHLSPLILEAYRSGHLTPDERQRIAPHVDACEHCQARLDQPDSLLAEVVRHAAPTPPKIAKYEYILDNDGFPLVLGRGGLGVVFLARYTGLPGNPLRAVKVLHTGQQIDRRARERFLREVQAITGLAGQDNQGFVQVFQCGETRRRCLYYVMEYVRGGDLHKRVKQQLPEPMLAAQWMLTLAQTMEVAHRIGIFHRDLKPGNVLLELEDAPAHVMPVVRNLKIADFSHARLTQTASDLSRDEPVGTPNYMSPEQARGKPVDARADVYGLCAILYELLTGKPPYSAGSPQATMELVRSDSTAPAHPATFNAALAQGACRDLVSICMKGLEKEPSCRYGTVHELVEDLQRFLKGEATRARPMRWPEQVKRLCRRHPGRVALAASALVVCAVTVSGAVYLRHKAERARVLAELGEQELITVLQSMVGSSRPISVRTRTYQPSGGAELLLSARNQCRRLLELRPDNVGIRVALTRVLAGLADVYIERCQVDESERCLEEACVLWQTTLATEPRNPLYRTWYALTRAWQASSHAGHGLLVEALDEALEAESLWLALNEEQPDNQMLVEQTLENHRTLFDLLTTEKGRAEFRQPLEERQAILERQVQGDAANRVLRQELAFNSLFLGELHFHIRFKMEDAVHFWELAASNYELLQRDRSDVLIDLPMSIACARLMVNEPAWYDKALRANTRATDHLERMIAIDPGANRLQQVRLRMHLETALCHWSAGCQEEGATALQAGLEHLDTLLHSQNMESIERVYLVEQLLDLASKLRETHQFEQALAVTRGAALRIAELAENPTRDRETTGALAAKMHAVATLLTQLGQASDAIPVFKRGLKLFQRLSDHLPENINYFQGVSDAHMGLGKALARLNQDEDSLSSLRAAAAVQQKLVAHFPEVLSLRVSLSRSFDRLHSYAVRFEKRAEAAHALRERASLWPGNRAELDRVAHSFHELAHMLDRVRRDLTALEQAQNKEYLTESERFAVPAVAILTKPAARNRGLETVGP